MNVHNFMTSHLGFMVGGNDGDSGVSSAPVLDVSIRSENIQCYHV